MRIFAIIACVTMVLVATGASGQTPTISNGNGTFATGGGFVLQGSNFGTKGVPDPVKYDDFESGSNGSDLTGWSIDDGGTPISGIKNFPEYSNFQTRPGSSKSVALAFESSQYLNTFGVYDPNGMTSVYVDFWFFVDRPSGSAQSRNHKVFRLYATRDGGLPNHYLQFVCDARGTNAYYTNDGVDGGWGDTHAYTGWPSDNAVGNWVHIQAWCKQSDSAVLNGELKAWFDGEEVINRSNYLTRGPDNNSDWHSVWFGNFYSTGSDDICTERSENTVLFLDNVYVDITQARVEAGNNQDYQSCTHREIQVPTAWNDNEISFTVNAGSFNPDEQVWLFVIDKNGVVSSGKGPFLVDGVPVEAPGQPGQPIHGN